MDLRLLKTQDLNKFSRLTHSIILSILLLIINLSLSPEDSLVHGVLLLAVINSILYFIISTLILFSLNIKFLIYLFFIISIGLLLSFDLQFLGGTIILSVINFENLF